MKKILFATLLAVLCVGVHAKEATTKYERALINAAKDGNASQVRGLLEAGTDPNVTDENAMTPLHMVAGYAKQNSLVITDMLLYAKADVNAKNAEGTTPLMLAFENNLSLVDRLLNAGADVNVHGTNGKTPLMYAAKMNLALVNKLLSMGADVNAKADYSCTPLIFSFIGVGPEAKAIRERILKANPDVNAVCQPTKATTGGPDLSIGAPCDVDATALSVAIADNDMEGVKLLLKHGADVNALLNFKLPLTTALFSKEPGSSKMVELLLNAGANPWWKGLTDSPCDDTNASVTEKEEKCQLIAKAREKDYELFFAAFNNNLKKVKKMLAKGANPNYYSNSHTTLIATKDAEITQALIDAGADINARNGHALRLADVEKTKVLIKAGANVNLPDVMFGQTPLFTADAQKSQLLIDAGANVNWTDLRGRTPLFGIEDAEKVQVLVKAGADVNARDPYGSTPLCYAKTAEAAKALINAGADLKVRNLRGENLLYCTKTQGSKDVAAFLERYGLTLNSEEQKSLKDFQKWKDTQNAKMEAFRAQRQAEREAQKAQQPANDDGESLGKTFLKGVAQAGAATLQYGIENNKF